MRKRKNIITVAIDSPAAAGAGGPRGGRGARANTTEGAPEPFNVCRLRGDPRGVVANAPAGRRRLPRCVIGARAPARKAADHWTCGHDR